MSAKPLIGRSAALVISTPEGVRISYLLAGPITRALALFLDQLCIMGAIYILYMVLSIFSPISQDITGGMFMLGYFLISVGYGMGTEWAMRGQSIGKRVMNLRVMDVQGLKLAPSQIIVRNLLRFVDSFPMLYVLGGIVCLFTRRYQRLGDIAANTVVVRVLSMVEPDLDSIIPAKYNSLRAHPHLATRLRQKATPAEASIALRALMRREQFDPPSRVEVFAAVADRFKALVRFPEEATLGLSDEQYVASVADILFRETSRKR